MASPLSGPLAKRIDKAFKSSKLPLSGTLYREASTTLDANNDPVVTYTSYTFRGYVDEYSDTRRATAGIPMGDRIAAIFGASLSVVPEIGDVVKYPGYNHMKLREVPTDPAKALYECQAYEVDDPTA